MSHRRLRRTTFPFFHIFRKLRHHEWRSPPATLEVRRRTRLLFRSDASSAGPGLAARRTRGQWLTVNWVGPSPLDRRCARGISTERSQASQDPLLERELPSHPSQRFLFNLPCARSSRNISSRADRDVASVAAHSTVCEVRIRLWPVWVSRRIGYSLVYRRIAMSQWPVPRFIMPGSMREHRGTR